MPLCGILLVIDVRVLRRWLLRRLRRWHSGILMRWKVARYGRFGMTWRLPRSEEHIGVDRLMLLSRLLTRIPMRMLWLLLLMLPMADWRRGRRLVES